jgi:hypothetical protein
MNPKLSLVLIALLVAGCDSTAPIPIADVMLSLASIDVGAGGTHQLEATIVDASGAVVTGRSVTWTSTDPAIAEVSASGLVTAKALGLTTVTAAIDGVSATALIRVPAQQKPMDAQVAYWVERAIGFELYNGYVVGHSGYPTNIFTGCPHGGSVHVAGEIEVISLTVYVSLAYTMQSCRVNLTGGELSVTGRITMNNSWHQADRFESGVYQGTDVTISGTARLVDGTPFSVDQRCSFKITRSTPASASSTTLEGMICGRPFSR